MKIDGKEIKFKITPRALSIVEERNPDFNIVETYINCSNSKSNPKIKDCCKILYAGWLGAKNEDISYEEFMEKIEDISFLSINNAAVEILNNVKN